MYPIIVAGILNRARRIHFFVLCDDEVNYEYYVEKCIGDKECSVSYKSHKEISLKYHIMAKQFLLKVKLEYLKNCHLN